MGTGLKIFLLVLFPFLLNSQSEGGFGYRRFSNTTTLNNVAPSNINTSHSRNAYVHSNGLYYVWDGNSWEREHDIDTLSISGTDLFISLYGDGVPAKTVDLSTATGFGVNIFNSDGVQTDLERYFDVNDSQILGIGEFPNFPVLNLDGTEKGYFYDPASYGTMLLDGDGAGGISQIYVSTVESNISYDNSGVENSIITNPTGIELQSLGGNDISIVSDEISFSHYNNSILNINFLNSTKMNIDSLYEFSLGRFPNFPSAPAAYSSYGIHMDGDGFTGKRMRILGKRYDNLGYSQIQARASNIEMEAISRASTTSAANNYFFAGIGTAFYQILFNDDALYNETRIGALKKTPGAGNPGGFRDFSYMYHGTGKDGADTLAISMFLGVPQSTDTTGASEFAYGNFRGWALQSHVRPGAVTDSEAYNWIEARMGHTWADTSTNAIGFYKSKEGGKGYYFPNATPGVDCDSCVWVTTGITSSSSHTFLMDKSAFGGSSVNIYNADGTQDDADRYFTIDSSQTFAMGQFNSFPASTWGRGFYYDPSNNDGIRILNKDGSNTSTTKVELDPFGITIHSDFSNSDATHTFSGLSESANQVLSVDRTSDTYGAISIAEVTNTNEEIVALVQNGKGTTPNVSMYLGDGYSSSQYAKYAERAWGVQSHVTSGSFDWIQVLLPDTGTDTTGNNLNFYNRKYYWVNTVPSPTVGDSSVHIWVGNGTTTTPLFVPFSTITAGAPNIYNSNGTTTDNTRTATITESIQWVGTADLGVDAYPFQIHSTGNEPLIQLWKGNTDSVYLYQSDVEYVFGSSTRMVIWPQSDLTVIADSTAIQGVADVSKIRRLIGFAASGYLKAFDGDAQTAGTILKSDGTDWTLGDWLSTYSSATQSTSAWTATNAASDVNAAIVPKGTGALTVDVPDGGTGGGNSRGADAVDLQTTRDAATQVASGTYSGIFAGRRNTVSGTGAVILGGADNIVSGQGSFIIGGYTGFSIGGAHLVSGTNSGILGGVQDTVTGNNSYVIGAQAVASGTLATATGALSRAYLTGQRAHAVSTFVADNPGFSQTSTLIASRAYTGTSQVELFLDGGSAQAILLGTNRSWNFSIQIVGICSTVGNGVGISAGDTWTSWHVGGIKRLNTTTSLVGTVQAPATAQSDAGMSTSTITIDADDSTEALRIRVTPPSTAGTTTVIRWVAYISLAESAY